VGKKIRTKTSRSTRKTLHRKIAGIVAGAAIIGASVFVTFRGEKPVELPAYIAVRVFDGDTFETVEKQYIRLSGIDSPETGLCGSKEAKATLEKLILGNPLYIKILYHIRSRAMGLIYTKDGFVNAAMLASGWAELNDKENLDSPEMIAATKKAREEKRGVFGKFCTQEVNLTKPSCVIKGNVRTEDEMTYHVPGCASYSTAVIQLHHGDRWFCSEKEAQKAGFRKAKTCPPE
jgi:micrococcal nuclease